MVYKTTQWLWSITFFFDLMHITQWFKTCDILIPPSPLAGDNVGWRKSAQILFFWEWLKKKKRNWVTLVDVVMDLDTQMGVEARVIKWDQVGSSLMVRMQWAEFNPNNWINWAQNHLNGIELNEIIYKKRVDLKG